MTEEQDKQQTTKLEQVNDELTRSLMLCHSLVDDYRTKLAERLNETEAANDDEDGDSAPR